jgi:hypothetical protein
MNIDVFVEQFLTGKKDYKFLVEVTLHESKKEHGPIRSPHEGLAVIWEEFEELKAEIFKKNLNVRETLKELASVSAMCQRLAEDCLLAATLRSGSKNNILD